MTTTDLRYPVLNREAKRRLIPRLPNASPKVPFGLGGWGLGLGLGARGLDGPSASRSRPQPRSPSIRKRCARGFPQGTAEPLRHASNNELLNTKIDGIGTVKLGFVICSKFGPV